MITETNSRLILILLSSHYRRSMSHYHGYFYFQKKAQEAHRLLDRLGPRVELPLYNQPSDTPVYQENRSRHQACMRARLVARLRREHAERASLHRQQSHTYATLVQEWHRKVDRLEGTQKKKTKESKNREFFEKVFPELRKQREDKERFNRVGARIKSEADLEEILDGLQEQEVNFIRYSDIQYSPSLQNEGEN